MLLVVEVNDGVIKHKYHVVNDGVILVVPSRMTATVLSSCALPEQWYRIVL